MATQTQTSVSDLAGAYALDPAHTRLGFAARHAMVTKVRGSFNSFEGTIKVGTQPEDSSASVVVEAASIDTRNSDRDAHLRSNDFLAMEQYPEIRFESSSIEPVGDTTYAVSGDLTIRGVTRPVTIEFEFTGHAVDPFGNERIAFEGTATINRKDWGVNWNAPLEAGGVLVSEKVVLELEISAIRQS